MSSWASVSFTTLCNAISDIPFYETFNSDSSTENCWTVLNENGIRSLGYELHIQYLPRRRLL